MTPAAGLLRNLGRIGEGFRVAVVPLDSRQHLYPEPLQLFGIAFRQHPIHAVSERSYGLQNPCIGAGNRLPLDFWPHPDHERTQHVLVRCFLRGLRRIPQVAIRTSGAVHPHFTIDLGRVQVHRRGAKRLHLALVSMADYALRFSIEGPSLSGQQQHQHREQRIHHASFSSLFHDSDYVRKHHGTSGSQKRLQR
ncbi:MAG: hypothetical protein ACD_55C00159G0001 [uncultured bacterium]|nr:MAG: hypothetical protein ACD_55C00159G0001 [uncultured bacterium]